MPKVRMVHERDIQYRTFHGKRHFNFVTITRQKVLWPWPQWSYRGAFSGCPKIFKATFPNRANTSILGGMKWDNWLSDSDRCAASQESIQRNLFQFCFYVSGNCGTFNDPPHLNRVATLPCETYYQRSPYRNYTAECKSERILKIGQCVTNL